MTPPSSLTTPRSSGLTAVRRLALSQRRAAVSRRSKRYADTSGQDIVVAQNAMLRIVWETAVQQQPFYRMWAHRHKLPSRIEEVRELEGFPPLTKEDLREHHDLVFARSSPTNVYSTGGSTGTPVNYPRGRGEALERYAGAFVARSWYGIEPGDSYVHLWGASHQFGAGRLAIIRRWRRHLLNRGLGAVRLNAYDLSPEMLARYARQIWETNPVFVAGYSSSVIRVARAARSQGLDHASLTRLKAILVTAETISDVDRDVLTAVFGVPVINEYGSAETGAIAVSSGDTWPLRVLWDSVAVTPGEQSEIHVTTLHPRAFPLINYRIGDRATGLSIEQGSVLQIENIDGRRQDDLRLRRADGRQMVASAILPTHILKGLSIISSVQIHCQNEHVTLYITADDRLDANGVKDFFLAQVADDGTVLDPTFLHVVQVKRPQLTPGGKQLLMIPRPFTSLDAGSHEVTGSRRNNT